MSVHCKEGCVGRYFGIPDAPCLNAAPVKRSEISATKITRQVTESLTVRVDIPAQDAYFLMLYLQDVLHCDLAADGTRTPVRKYPRGSICLVDLEAGVCIELHSSLYSLAFVLPRAVLKEVTEITATTTPKHLQCKRGEPDVVLSSIGMAILPFLDNPTATVPAAFQPIAIALCLHVLDQYGNDLLRNGESYTSLSPWQEKAAKEFIIDHLAENISVEAIAAAAGLSVGHFSKEFKRATGLSPHQWLTRMRIDRAKDLLGHGALPLKSVADRCGFSDQSHFSKVFSKKTGFTPAHWRASHFH